MAWFGRFQPADEANPYLPASATALDKPYHVAVGTMELAMDGVNSSNERAEAANGLRELSSDVLDPFFWQVERMGVSSAWWQHVPFAHWLVGVLQPRLVVELGTHNGVSYSALCNAVVRCGVDAKCFAVDSWIGDEHASFYGPSVYESLQAFHDERFSAFSQLIRSSFDAAVAFFEDGSIDLLHIDGLHTYDAVSADFATWLPKLSDRAVVLFHDTNERQGTFGVWRLWAELRRQYPGFEFFHGHGLGVLGVGKQSRDFMASFTALSPDAAAALRQRMARLGERWDEANRAGLMEQEVVRLRAGAEQEATQHRAAAEQQTAQFHAAAEAERHAAAAKLTVAAAEADRLRIEAGTLRDRTRSLQDAAALSARGAALAEQRMATTNRQLEQVINERDAIELQRLGLMQDCHALRRERERLEAELGAHQTELGQLAASTAWRVAKVMVRGLDVVPPRTRKAARYAVGTLRATMRPAPTSLAPLPPPPPSPATLPTGLDASLRAEILASDLFDAAFYARLYEDVAGVGDPLDHFVTTGLRQGRQPSPGFDPFRYVEQDPAVGQPGDALIHYLRFGRDEGRQLEHAHSTEELFRAAAQISSSGLFDEAFYRASNPVVTEEQLDPVLHYLLWGGIGQCDVAADMPMHAYVAAYPDLRMIDANPLFHWLNHGLGEGRRLLGRSPEPAWVWSFDDTGPRPDDAVGFETLRGSAFFTAHRFSFHSATHGHVRKAVDRLALRQPLLEIDFDTPEVSIVIPVYGQLPFVLNCLDSLAAHHSRSRVEIIVADDSSPPESLIGMLAAVPWVRIERTPQNGGFIECCNFAAARAKGRILIFLNSDTRVVDGWLDELADSFVLFPKAGLVGSKLFNADTTLQEAGGLLWNDGSAWNYGRDSDPNHPRYCFARQVDYVSGASVAVLATAWQALGGFDDEFRPAYYEDVDLAFRLRRAGYETWFQPCSRVIHYDGRTHGTDLVAGPKSYIALNKRLIVERFAKELERHGPPGGDPHREAGRWLGARMLVLDAEMHRPDRDAGSVVASGMLQAFRHLGYSQVFVPTLDTRWKPGYSDALQRIGVEIHYRPYTNGLIDLLQQQYLDFRFVLGFRYYVLLACIPALREHLPIASILFSNVDLHFMREEREAAITGNKLLRATSVLTKQRELETFLSVDCSIVHTAEEQSRIAAELPGPLDNIVELPWITEVSTSQADFGSRHTIMFLGSFRHPPNVDAVKFFVERVWPLLKDALPAEARFVIVGDAPTAEIARLAGDRITVTGYVPDLTGYFDQARVFVAPLRFGAGIKGKVIGALAHGTPCVATPIAVEGIGLQDGRNVVIADDAASIAAAILKVYFDETLWRSLQGGGYRVIEQKFSFQAAVETLHHALDVAETSWTRRQQATRTKRLHYLMQEAAVAAPVDDACLNHKDL